MSNQADKCHTCQQNLNKGNLVCFFCNKTRHMSKECTHCYQKCFEVVLIELTSNMLHVCTECEVKRSNKLKSLKMRSEKMKMN